MGDVIFHDFGNRRPVLLTKKQLAAHPEVRRSTRWIEQRVSDGTLPPGVMDGQRRMFPLDECLRRIASYRQKGAA